MVTTAATYALIEVKFAACGVGLLRHRAIRLLREAHRPGVGSPQKAAYVNGSTGEIDEHALHFRSGSCEALVRIPLPVGEPYCVAGAELAKLPIEAIEIRRAVDEHLDPVPSRPRRAVSVTPIDVRGVIAPLVRVEEPVSDLHRSDTTDPALRALRQLCERGSPSGASSAARSIGGPFRVS